MTPGEARNLTLGEEVYHVMMQSHGAIVNEMVVSALYLGRDNNPDSEYFSEQVVFIDVASPYSSDPEDCLRGQHCENVFFTEEEAYAGAKARMKRTIIHYTRALKELEGESE